MTTPRPHLTEHKRQRTTQLRDREREQARKLKTAAVSAWDRFLEDWKRATVAAMTRGQAR